MKKYTINLNASGGFSVTIQGDNLPGTAEELQQRLEEGSILISLSPGPNVFRLGDNMIHVGDVIDMNVNDAEYQDYEVEGCNEEDDELLEICSYIPASRLIPDGWAEWFWGVVAEDAPFSWGDNNKSLVCAIDFWRHCDDALLDAADEHPVTRKELDEFLDRLRSLGDTYIDLES